MSNYQGLINRALKNGFDLSTLPNYNEKAFKEKFYEYFVSKNYIVVEEGDSMFISYDVVSDVAEVFISDNTLLISPLSEDGFFDIFMEILKFISELTEQVFLDEDENTESYSEETLKKVLDDDDDSEEMWI